MFETIVSRIATAARFAVRAIGAAANRLSWLEATALLALFLLVW